MIFLSQPASMKPQLQLLVAVISIQIRTVIGQVWVKTSNQALQAGRFEQRTSHNPLHIPLQPLKRLQLIRQAPVESPLLWGQLSVPIMMGMFVVCSTSLLALPARKFFNTYLSARRQRVCGASFC
jgi:hypothetical protein